MLAQNLLIFLVLCGQTWAQSRKQVPGFEYEEPILYDTFPDGFLWGTATASYQVFISKSIELDQLN